MNKKILIVDDNAMNLRMAEMILQKENYETITVKSGQLCLEMLAKEEIGLVLLDLEMPEMDGLETLGKIRANEIFGMVPVILLTASGDVSKVGKAVALGASGYIKKPFVPKNLIGRVASELE